MVIASSIPVVFSAGADIKAFTQMDEAGGEELIHSGHALLRDMGLSRVSTVAAVNSLAFGGGCELAMACNFRIAAESAVFGQPEIKLGIIPGFGGTQRLPRLVGDEKALEMNLIGDAISAGEAEAYGLANRVVPDHELFDTALSWARKLAGQAPLAVEQVKLASDDPDLDEGIEKEKQGFAHRVHQRGRARRASAPSSASARPSGRGSSRRGRAAELASLIREARLGRRARPAPGSRCRPGSPTSARPGTGLWEKVDPMEVAHIDAFHRDTKRFWSFYRPRFADLDEKQPNPRPRGARRARGARAARRGRHPEHRPPALQGRLGAGDRGPRLDRDLELHHLPDQLSARERRRALRRRRRRDLRLLHGQGEARRRPLRRAAARGGDGRGRSELCAERRPAALRRLLARGLPGRRPAGAHARRRRPARDRHPGPDPVRRRAPRSSSTATWSTSSGRCSRRCRGRGAVGGRRG